MRYQAGPGQQVLLASIPKFLPVTGPSWQAYPTSTLNFFSPGPGCASPGCSYLYNPSILVTYPFLCLCPLDCFSPLSLPPSVSSHGSFQPGLVYSGCPRLSLCSYNKLFSSTMPRVNQLLFLNMYIIFFIQTVHIFFLILL